jgi:hypothetical protein
MTRAQDEVVARGLDELFDLAGDPSTDAWRKMMDGAQAAQPVKPAVDPDIYAACFQTDAGRLVLSDLYRRYVHVTRAVPGAGADAAFYREGMAQVVFDIVDRITQAHEGE